MAQAVDCPYSLKSVDERKARQLLLDGPHVARLTSYVRQIRGDKGPGYQVPFFDPLDGGVSASCLYLLEAPGAQAVSSGFISRNNPDVSAKNFFKLNADARIPRKATVIWNIVPWYIGSGTRIRPAEGNDLAAGLPYLQQLFQLLPPLRIVVIMGKKPALAEKHIRAWRPDVDIYLSSHPSPLYVNRRPGNREKILGVLRNVARSL
jgi:uracil-DNA glycosylase